MKKKLFSIIVIIYIILAILVTVCLLSFNEYKVSVFGDKTLIIIDKDDSELEYKNGDLVIVGKSGYQQADKGDTVFFYEDRGIKIAKIVEKRDFGEAGMTFKIEGDYNVVPEDVIGTSKNQTVIGTAGQVLGLLESKWGFLFLIVFPSLVAFLHELYQLVLEIKDKK